MTVLLIFATLILPAIMEIAGLVMMLHPPENRRAFFAYRTRRSLLSDETWNFANYYCGTLYVYLGFYVVTATLLTDLVLKFSGAAYSICAAVAAVTAAVQIVCFLLPAVLVEAKLKANFDEEGRLSNPALDVRPEATYDDSDWDDWKDDWDKDEWKSSWRDEYSDWELWKKKRDAELAEERFSRKSGGSDPELAEERLSQQYSGPDPGRNAEEGASEERRTGAEKKDGGRDKDAHCQAAAGREKRDGERT